MLGGGLGGLAAGGLLGGRRGGLGRTAGLGALGHMAYRAYADSSEDSFYRAAETFSEDTALLLVRAMVAAANADGTISSAERAHHCPGGRGRCRCRGPAHD